MTSKQAWSKNKNVCDQRSRYTVRRPSTRRGAASVNRTVAKSELARRSRESFLTARRAAAQAPVAAVEVVEWRGRAAFIRNNGAIRQILDQRREEFVDIRFGETGSNVGRSYPVRHQL